MWILWKSCYFQAERFKQHICWSFCFVSLNIILTFSFGYSSLGLGGISEKYQCFWGISSSKNCIMSSYLKPWPSWNYFHIGERFSHHVAGRASVLFLGHTAFFSGNKLLWCRISSTIKFVGLLQYPFYLAKIYR